MFNLNFFYFSDDFELTDSDTASINSMVRDEKGRNNFKIYVFK